MAASLSLDNPVFANFAFYGTVVIMKMIFIAFWTGKTRFSKKAFANPEDFGGKMGVKPSDPDVERVKRVHNNDLENIPAFVLLGLLYVSCNPSPFMAFWHFRIFACARILHTVAYLNAIGPLRGVGYMAGIVVTVSMAVQVVMATM